MLVEQNNEYDKILQANDMYLRDTKFYEKNHRNNAKTYTLKKREIMEGERIYKRIVDIIANTEKFRLYEEQFTIIRLSLLSSTSRIFRKNYKERKDEILDLFNETDIPPITLLTAARRSGKTVVEAIMAIAASLAIPARPGKPFVIRVYSMFLKNAAAFISECSARLNGNIRQEYKDDFNIKINKTSIVFTNKKDPNDIRIIEISCSIRGVS